MKLRLNVATVLALLVVGCSTATPSGPMPSRTRLSATPLRAAARLPERLVGLWRVTDAAGEPAGSVLRFDGLQQPESLILFHRCGALSGSWVGSASGGFLALASGFPEACLKSVGAGDPTPGWLAAARSFTIDGTERRLLDAQGRVVARLLPGGQRLATVGLPPSLTLVPTLNAAERRLLNTAARPLPSNAAPATSAIIAGRWRPYPSRRYATPQQPYVAFSVDGPYTGSDGCNKLDGSWRLGTGGELLTMTGPSAGVGCNGAPIGSWLAWSGRASITSGVLALYASNGDRLGELTR